MTIKEGQALPTPEGPGVLVVAMGGQPEHLNRPMRGETSNIILTHNSNPNPNPKSNLSPC